MWLGEGDQLIIFPVYERVGGGGGRRWFDIVSAWHLL